MANLATGLKLKEKLLSAEIDIWGRAARNCTLLTVSNDVITEEIQVTNNFGGTAKRVEMARYVVH